MTSSIFAVALVLMAGASYVASTSYVAEVYFVVEPEVIQKYKAKFGYNDADALSNVNNDINYVISEVNEIFGTVNTNYGLDIQVRKKSLKVMGSSEEMFRDCILLRDDELQSDMALEVFKEWLKTTDAQNQIGYDIALVWTGYNLFGSAGNTQVAGYATTDVVCDQDNAVAVVEFDGLHNTAITTAHEIAHSMGAPHDSGSSCPAASGFVETPVSNPTNQMRWEFSYCSYVAMFNKINALNAATNCLTQTTASALSFNLAAQSTKDIFDIQKTCQRATQTTNAYFCQSSNLYNYQPISGDTVCKYIFCGVRGTTTCKTTMPAEGMPCGINKRCEKGSCVASSVSTPGVTDNDCPFGDTQSQSVQGQNQTCQHYVDTNGGSLCYQSSFRAPCCAACKTKETNIPNCEYGDKSSQCSLYTQAQICGNNAHICCEMCHNYRRRRSSDGEGSNVKLTEPTNKDPTVTVDDKTNNNVPVSQS